MKTKKKLVFNIIFYSLLTVVFVITTVSFGFNSIYTPIVVSGTSMSPNLKSGEFGYANKTKRRINKIKRNDIVIFKPYENDDAIYIKRVIALPNETFYLDSSTCDIKINGEVIPQSYIEEDIKVLTDNNAKKEFLDKEIVLGSDEFILLGDNRGNSLDSLHGLGVIKKDRIIGVLDVIVATCDSGSYDDTSKRVCNFNQRNYYSIKDWKYY